MWNDVLKIHANNKKDTLNKKIAQHLLDLDKDVLSTNLTKEAKALNVSPSTITKFLHKVGYSGWKMYTAIALLNVNHKQTEIRDRLLGEKIEVGAWIDLIYSEKLKLLSKKILKASKVVLLAYGNTRNLIKMFKRNLSILEIDVDIIDLADKYAILPTKVSSVMLMFSLTGNNDYVNNIQSKLSKQKHLGSKNFISPSKTNLPEVDLNINLSGSSINLNKLENILPMIKVYFINHVIDKIMNNILIEQKYSLSEKFVDQKIWEK